jgi:tRNA-dihydrouridine synthase A
MLGRAAYHRPSLLAELEAAIVDPAWPVPQPREVIDQIVAYAQTRGCERFRLHSITRHLHGVMAGRAGARAWRRFLSEVAARPEARPETLFGALAILEQGLAA